MRARRPDSTEMKEKKSERQDEIVLALLQNGKAILFSRTWHEMAMKIGQRENVDPDALEGFALAYQVIMNLCPPVSALLHHFTWAGAASNRAGMKRFLDRISNRHSVPRARANGKRVRQTHLQLRPSRQKTAGRTLDGTKTSVGNTFPRFCLQKNSACPGMKA